MVPNWFLDYLQPFLVKPSFDQVPNKGFALLAAGQLETRLQELRLRGSYFDGSWQAMPSITTFLSGATSATFYIWSFVVMETLIKMGLEEWNSSILRQLISWKKKGYLLFKFLHFETLK